MTNKYDIPILFLAFAIGIFFIFSGLNTSNSLQHTLTPGNKTIALMYSDNTIQLTNIKEPAMVEGIGDSMLPTLPDYSKVIIEQNFTSDEVKVGDIITYTPEPSINMSILHRVVWRNETHFRTQGDNNKKPDSYQKLSAVDGIVRVIIY